VKKGRHRRFEEARALKRSQEVDLHDLFDSISDNPDDGDHKPEHDAWADLAEEWDAKETVSDDGDADEDQAEHNGDVAASPAEVEITDVEP
jgi:hypothetical protein